MLTDLDQPFSLSIDKISLTCNDPNPDQVEKTCHRLAEAANTGTNGIKIRSSRWHRFECALPIPDRAGTFLIQAGPRYPGFSDYRFEFNPSVIGATAIAYASSVIGSLTDTAASTLFANGKVTRLDIALDLPGLSLDDVVVRSLGQRKHAVYTDGKGRLETIYLGSGKGSRTVVYKKISGDFEFLRVERRMRPNILGYELERFPNPFDRVQMISTKSLEPHLGGMIPQQFFDTVRMRGLGHAIAGMPPHQRRAVKGALADPAESLLPSMPLVWKCWSDVLKESGLDGLCGDNGNREAAE
jgi:hypothetical protein